MPRKYTKKRTVRRKRLVHRRPKRLVRKKRRKGNRRRSRKY